MTRQRRFTLIGVLALSVLLTGTWVLVGGNSAPDREVVAASNDVIATSSEGTAPPTTAGSAPSSTPTTSEAGVSTTPPTTASVGFGFPEDMVFPDAESDTAEPPTTTSTTSSTSSTSSTTSTTTTILAPDVGTDFKRSVFLKEGFATFGTDDAETIIVEVGDDADDALNAAIATLGQPTSDTGLVEDDDCSSIRVRRVRFGGLELVLAEQVEDVITFEQWFLDGDLPAGVPLEIEDGLKPGLAVADLLAIDVLMVIFRDDDGSGSFKMPGDTSNSPVWGRTTGAESSDTVEAIWSGSECRRL